jgi:hypothetical protein
VRTGEVSHPPFRVIVWGPGGLGTLCIREISLNPAFALAGVRVYSESKHGVDAGTLAGIAPLGVPASSRVDELLAIPCDCILYTARDFGQYESEDEIVRLLEAGRNVITTLPYQHLDIARSPLEAARIETACRKGQSRFHATGINPSLIPDRILLALTGLCNEVRSIKAQEYWDVSNLQKETRQICGFGIPAEEAKSSPVLHSLADNFLKQSFMYLAGAVGVTYDRVEQEAEHAEAPEAVVLRDGRIGAGMVGRITRRWVGYVKEIGPDPFLTVEMNWTIGRGMLPPKFPQVSGYHGYLLTIEGRPSVNTLVDLSSDLAASRDSLPGDDAGEAGYSAVVATVLQAVPQLRRAPPGILRSPPPPHWRKDYRTG